MGHILVEQPNGKFAIFSSVVDSFVLIDGSIEEVFKYEFKIERDRILNDIKKWAINCIQHPRTSWEDCLELDKEHSSDSWVWENNQWVKKK